MPNKEARYIPARRPSAIGRAVLALRGFLARFFAAKSPLNFETEIGDWSDPDVILSSSETVGAPPKPLVNNDCDKSHLIYSVAIKTVAGCNLAVKIDVLREAIESALDYFDNHFECRNPKCIRKVGEILWLGMSCGNNPLVATAAVLVRFRCELEL